MQLTKTDGGTFDNDAKACFDRIIPALTTYAATAGVPRLATRTAELLLKATYASRRNLRSVLQFQRRRSALRERVRVLGGPQQRGSSLAHSSSVSCPKRQTDSVPRSPTTLTVKRIMDGFVDDTTIWHPGRLTKLDALSQGSIGEIAARQDRHSGGNNSCTPQAGSKFRNCPSFLLLHWVLKGGTTCHTRGT
jgi:hypothetical protein